MARKKAKKNRSVVARLAFLAFVIYSVATLTYLQIQLVSTRDTLALMDSQKKQKENTNEQLRERLENGTQKEFIESAARDKLGFVYGDEQIFIDTSGK